MEVAFIGDLATDSIARLAYGLDSVVRPPVSDGTIKRSEQGRNSSYSYEDKAGGLPFRAPRVPTPSENAPRRFRTKNPELSAARGS